MFSRGSIPRLKQRNYKHLRSNIMKTIAKHDWFVYQNWVSESLYASNLTSEEAEESQAELNRLIESGCCGDGCACCGQLSEPSDYHVSKRLGLIN